MPAKGSSSSMIEGLAASARAISQRRRSPPDSAIAGLDRSFTTEQRRDGNRLFFEGPEAWGNAQAFGRGSFGNWHFTDADKVKSREVTIDAEPGMSAGRRLAVVYEIFHGAQLDSVLHGVLEWEDAA